MSQRTLFQPSALRRAQRIIQDITRESQNDLSPKVVPRPSWFFAGANANTGAPRVRHASTTSSGKPKPTVSQDPTKTRRKNPAASETAGAAKRSAPRVSGTAAPYVAYGATKKLFDVCAAQADYKVPQAGKKDAEVPKAAGGEDLGVGEGWWYQSIGLEPTFASWSQVTFLHMYLLTVRMRNFPSDETVHEYSRHLIDHFSHEAERRMDVLHGISSRPVRSKYLKDIFLQWRGILAAYDEGLIKGDAVLGAAVWRNLFKGAVAGPNGQEELDWTQIARVVAYMRRVLVQLAAVDDVSLVHEVSGGPGSGTEQGIFVHNQHDDSLVGRTSKGLDEPFGEDVTTNPSS